MFLLRKLNLRKMIMLSASSRKNCYSLHCGKIKTRLTKSLKIALLIAKKLYASERKTVVLIRKAGA